MGWRRTIGGWGDENRVAAIRALASLAKTPQITGVELICNIDAETRYQIPAPALSFGGSLDAGSQAWNDGFLSQVEAISPAVGVYHIHDCLVTPNAGIVTLSGSVIQESLYPYVRSADISNAFQPFFLGNTDGIEDDIFILTRNLTRIRAPIMFGRDHGEAGYFHWLHSVIPRTVVYDGFGRSDQKLLVANHLAFQVESLAALGWDTGMLCQSDGNTLVCDRLTYATPMVAPDLDRSGGFFERSLFANKALRKLSALSTDRAGPKKFFVSRANTQIRRLIEEANVVAQLQLLGIEPVILEDLPFRQQVDLFSNADLVIGVHGAGLANIVFMEPHSCVIEMLTPTRLWPTYRGVAARSELHYFPYVGTTAGEQRHNDGDVALNCDHFMQFVSAVQCAMKS